VKLLKTVVGSFPPKKLSLLNAVKWAVDIQLAHGIDLISDGEQRSDMIGYFSSFPGLGMKSNGPYVKSKVMPLGDALSFVKLRDFRFVKDYLRSRRREDVKVKISVTGPITLGFACACNGLQHYSGIGDLKLYSDFAQALRPLINEIAETGCYVQIDEPSLSIRVMDARNAVKIVNEALSGLPASVHREGKLAVHICGPITETLFDELINLDAPVLSLAFSGPNVRKNLKAISKRTLKSQGKKIGVGCVSVQASHRNDVEKLDTVIRRLDALKEKIGKDAIAFVHPDCGLRNTAEDAVEPILEMVTASAQHLQEMEQTTH
jgi:methionine synthase II (cobalamin-independent)